MKKLLTACLALAATFAHAVPACPDPFEAEHPDGGKTQFWLRGDEFFSWVEDKDGVVYKREYDAKRTLEEGYAPPRIQYAKVEGEQLVPREAGSRQRLHREEIMPLAREVGRKGRISMSAMEPPALLNGGGGGIQQSVFNPVISAPQRMLVVVVSFSNVQATQSAAFWQSRFFGETGKTVNTYFRAVSKNRFWFTPAPETQGTANDGIVFVTLPYAHPNPGGGSTLGEVSRKIGRDALNAAAAHINFAAYDTNGDRTLSVNELNLVFIIAGYEASFQGAPSPNIWGHSTGGMNVTLNGVTHNANYCMQGEFHGSSPSNRNPAAIGIFCHELGHNLGLYDLYDYTQTSRGVGIHDIMGAGSWGKTGAETVQGTTPTFLSAFHRYYLGFTTPKVVDSGTHSLRAASQAALADEEVLKITTGVSSEYFLVENRQPTGFDQGFQLSFGSGATAGGIAI